MTNPTKSPTGIPSRSRAGFSLVELLVAMAMTSIVLGSAFMIFEFSTRLSRVQTQIADLQQSIRIAQYDMVRRTRMAGRGGLTAPLAVLVRSHVDKGKFIADSNAKFPKVLTDTDVLTVRGVFSSPIYQINALDDASFNLLPEDDNPTTAVSGTLVVPRFTTVGIEQDLAPLKELIEPPGGGGHYPDALILISPDDERTYGIVEVTNTGSDVGGTEQVTIGFKVSGGTYTDGYGKLMRTPGVLPAALTTVAYVGILEEYRYYVREEYEVAGESASARAPKLSIARFFPGTEEPYGRDEAEQQSNVAADLADNVVDLQVALGYQVAGVLDWLYDDDKDNPKDAKWTAATTQLQYVRVNTLARTDRPDRGYVAPVVDWIEDRAFTKDDPLNTIETDYRRREMQTVIDMRNL